MFNRIASNMESCDFVDLSWIEFSEIELFEYLTVCI